METEDYTYVIARWRVNELLSGIGSVEIYPILNQHGIDLFIHRELHAKLYLFSSGNALCGSGNATSRGLGTASLSNIELAVKVLPDLEDEVYLKKLRDQSVAVTPDIYKAFQQAMTCATIGGEADFNDLVYEAPDTQFLTSSLPAMETPEEFLELYERYSAGEEIEGEKRGRFINDLCNLNLDLGIDRKSIVPRIEKVIKNHGLITALVADIRKSGPHRFGYVTNFIQTNCRDVPLPYRWELKKVVQTMYNWLEFFFEDIKWCRPNVSQIIYSMGSPRSIEMNQD